MKKKNTGLLIILFFTCTALFGQTVEEGKKFLYYERYNSAKDVLNRLVNANPNNIDAVYWLGQTYIGEGDSLSAKILYHETLSANPKAPLILVGLGEIALMENKTNEALFRFEVANGLTKEKDYKVINAIARSMVEAKAGDASYAIAKLKTIPEDKRTAEIWTTLGDAYRKITDGTNAQKAYQKALEADPYYARANFMIGRILQTQGFKQEPYYMNYYNQAISSDPKYAPVYYWLYAYYYERDVNRSREYLDKYIAVADADEKSCYYQASILYASGQFQQAIKKSDECIAANAQEPYLKLYGLKAFAYEKLGDSVNAKTFFEMYFQKQKPGNLLSGDYATYGRVLLKFPGNEVAAAGYIEKAIELDTLESKKIEYITSAANAALSAKNYAASAKWYARLLEIKKNVTRTDIYNAGINYYRGGNYKTADSVFSLYKQKYPDDLIGYYYAALSKANIDSTAQAGLAMPDYEKVIELASVSADTARAKQLTIIAYNYMLNYYYHVKKDKTKAIFINDKILSVDPSNAQAIENDKILKSTAVKEKGN